MAEFVNQQNVESMGRTFCSLVHQHVHEYGRGIKVKQLLLEMTNRQHIIPNPNIILLRKAIRNACIHLKPKISCTGREWKCIEPFNYMEQGEFLEEFLEGELEERDIVEENMNMDVDEEEEIVDIVEEENDDIERDRRIEEQDGEIEEQDEANEEGENDDEEEGNDDNENGNYDNEEGENEDEEEDIDRIIRRGRARLVFPDFESLPRAEVGAHCYVCQIIPVCANYRLPSFPVCHNCLFRAFNVDGTLAENLMVFYNDLMVTGNRPTIQIQADSVCMESNATKFLIVVLHHLFTRKALFLAFVRLRGRADRGERATSNHVDHIFLTLEHSCRNVGLQIALICIDGDVVHNQIFGERSLHNNIPVCLNGVHFLSHFAELFIAKRRFRLGTGYGDATIMVRFPDNAVKIVSKGFKSFLKGIASTPDGFELLIRFFTPAHILKLLVGLDVNVANILRPFLMDLCALAVYHVRGGQVTNNDRALFVRLHARTRLFAELPAKNSVMRVYNIAIPSYASNILAMFEAQMNGNAVIWRDATHTNPTEELAQFLHAVNPYEAMVRAADFNRQMRFMFRTGATVDSNFRGEALNIPPRPRV